jgi:hypothetical protein
MMVMMMMMMCMSVWGEDGARKRCAVEDTKAAFAGHVLHHGKALSLSLEDERVC